AAHEVAEHAALHGAREPLGVFGTEARGLVEAKRAVVSGREEAINDDDVEMENAFRRNRALNTQSCECRWRLVRSVIENGDRRFRRIAGSRTTPIPQPGRSPGGWGRAIFS
ncbi:MAG: hypothetical protein ACREM1_04900, partial [Longimicrobiales bacterium]